MFNSSYYDWTQAEAAKNSALPHCCWVPKMKVLQPPQNTCKYAFPDWCRNEWGSSLPGQREIKSARTKGGQVCQDKGRSSLPGQREIKSAQTKVDQVCQDKRKSSLPQQREIPIWECNIVVREALFAGLVKQLMHLIGNLVFKKRDVPIMVAVFKKS